MESFIIYIYMNIPPTFTIGGSGSGMKPLLGALQQVTRHVYSPLLRTANASTSGPEGSNDAAGKTL